jgi:hypothetical protein
VGTLINTRAEAATRVNHVTCREYLVRCCMYFSSGWEGRTELQIGTGLTEQGKTKQTACVAVRV